jgi:anti-sigma-K factor RskA
MIDPRLEELAALSALGWTEDRALLERAASRDPEVAQAMREFGDVAAEVALEVPQVEPPPQLRDRIMAAVAPAAAVAPRAARPRETARIFRFPRFTLMPYAVAACLMGLALMQAALILFLDHRLDIAQSPAPHHDQFNGVQLVELAPQGDHGAAKLMVAWNGKTCCGMLSMANMPDAPAGKDYQLWVLDPAKPAPMSVGVIPRGARSQHFIAGGVKMPGRPGFAVSMEPAGGRDEPTPNAILFAVAPSP